MIDICVENSAAIGQLVDPLWLRSLHQAVDSRRSSHRSAKKTSHSSRQVKVDVRAIAAGLPLALAWAIWLVDVCGCSYEQAALEMSVKPDDFEVLIGEARLELRERLVAQGWTPGGI